MPQGRKPASAAATTPAGLILRDTGQHRAGRRRWHCRKKLTRRCGCQQHVQTGQRGPRLRAQKCPDGVVSQQLQRSTKSVTPAPISKDSQSGIPECPNLLPDCGPGEAHNSPQLDPRVPGTVSQQSEQYVSRIVHN